MPVAKWVREWQKGTEFVEHKDGVPWNKAPSAMVSHCCAAQTRGLVRVMGLPPMRISRCRCGATDLNDGRGWIDKNTRFLPESERRTVMWGAR